MNDTITAISTALGVGAISIIRVSGKNAISIVNKICLKSILLKESHTINYNFIVDKQEKIDEVLISVMKSPKTFTREDIVEISCHGGISITNKILELLLINGCRMAEPGEFTKRAFLNGRIDLVEADAVMDLISTKTEISRKIAMNNLQGNTTKKIKQIRKSILDLLTDIAVNIDYPEYLDIEEMTNEKLYKALTTLDQALTQLLLNSTSSQLIKNGINTAIIGRPNVGKSSILNLILDEEKAIVTDIAGTTRDIVEGTINLDGILINFIDTAGIRKTDNVIEQIGVKKSLEAINDSDLIILVLNSNDELTQEDLNILEQVKDKKIIIALNKNDLVEKINTESLDNYSIVKTNTLSKEGILPLLNKIKTIFNLEEIDVNNFNYLSNISSITKVKECLKIIKEIYNSIDDNLSIDMIEIDIKNIFNILGEIIGETYTDELLDNLFSKFCLGK